MIHNRVVVGVKNNSVALIHEPWVVPNIFRFLPSYRISIRIFWLRFSPFEENVWVVLTVRAPILMRLEERCLSVREPVCRVWEAVSVVRVFGLRPCNQRWPQIMMVY